MSIETILGLLSLHFVADFMFQSEEMAINKSKNNLQLTDHVLVYTGIWVIPMLIHCKFIGVSYPLTFAFLGITFVCHWITDYLTSRVVAQKFKNQEYYTPLPNLGAFTIIGFDQILHYLQIFITYSILFL